MNSFQHGAGPDREMGAYPIGKQPSLMEPALAWARGMRRHGNDRVETAFANTCVVERSNEPARDEMAEMNLFSVCEIETHVPNDPASAIGRDCGLEVKVSMRAIGAGE